ncbi:MULTISPECIES: GNAT family N-acetyltransferase [unclassified Bacillus (in: firmicutes)]|uniref:GNAT family N-acetyltransferase n=1 Tax=unclassified Bacillus (in: firmicutes) TaxID=185979 RepID=UPI001BE8F1BD|nr:MULTISPECIES: N-acetyltransferase [unclassified Bacillus (in: firmicutes)]MBT2618679.1 GNAT family N-acetyltransferase [Bacillus sp. ISL-78]MBT2632432.1 GNAT family N-acetyltransferase [Bacillus sp. ISL-101]MBT2717123.1 GNAT family N-acetyltransferase [Bacillus sp. ISL-57]
METVNIRTAAKHDIPQLLELMNQYIVDFYKCPRPSDDSLKKLINHLLENPYEGIQFVVEKEPHHLVGFSTLYFTFNTLEVKRMAFLHDLFVKPDVRGQKIGEKLLQSCVNYIRENDYSHMIWETAHDNLAAQSLYDKIGAQKAVWLNYEIK